jgi:hypothetical protein
LSTGSTTNHTVYYLRVRSEKMTTKNGRNDNRHDGDVAVAIAYLIDPMKATRMRKVALYIFLMALAVSVITGIVAILGVGDHGWEILLTSLSITLGSILILMILPAMTRGSRKWVALVFAFLSVIGVVTTILAVALLIPLIFIAFDHDDVSDPFWKSCVTFWFLSTAIAYICLMSGCDRAPVLLVALADVLAVVTLFLWWLGIVIETSDGWEALACLGLITAGLSVGNPVMHICRGKRSTASVEATPVAAVLETLSAGMDEEAAGKPAVFSPVVDEGCNDVTSQGVATETTH